MISGSSECLGILLFIIQKNICSGTYQAKEKQSMPNRVKVQKAEWDFVPKTKFLRVEGYVLTELGDEVIAKIAEPQGINEKILLINLEVKAGEELNVPFSTMISVPFYLFEMTFGDEPWEEVQVCLGDECTSLAITKIESEKGEKTVEAKTYHLSGNDCKIIFSMEDPNEMEFVYEDSQGERKFSGRAIYRDETKLGFMPSVIIVQVPDSHETTLSLAVPYTNIPENMKSVQVKTFAVRTTSRSSIGGTTPLKGQIQIYETLSLEGNAW